MPIPPNKINSQVGGIGFQPVFFASAKHILSIWREGAAPAGRQTRAKEASPTGGIPRQTSKASASRPGNVTRKPPEGESPGRPVSICGQGLGGVGRRGEGPIPPKNVNPISPLDTENQRTVRGLPYTPFEVNTGGIPFTPRHRQDAYASAYEQPIELPQLVHL